MSSNTKKDYTDDATCRICFEKGDLISPCLCTGSSKYVHSSCLEKWYAVEPTRGRNCTVCLEEFIVHRTYPLEVLSRGPRVYNDSYYFDPIVQFFISFVELYIFLMASAYYGLSDNSIKDIAYGINIGNQVTYICAGFRPWSIQNKKKYIVEIFTHKESLYIGIIYLFSFHSSFYTPWGGILIMNLVTSQLLHYHNCVLYALNQDTDGGYVFMNRPSHV
jgi:hypothetical protein